MGDGKVKRRRLLKKSSFELADWIRSNAKEDIWDENVVAEEDERLAA
jgi:hypothetical protein